MQDQELQYVGFWPRAGASIIDTILLSVITYPLLIWIYGWALIDPEGGVSFLDPEYLLVSVVLPAIAIVLFWMFRQATPGKMAISAKIVDAKTGQAPSNKQLIIRYFGYFVSYIPLFLGIFWVAFDKKKQGWHDKLAGTVVVRKAAKKPEPVQFDKA